MITKSIFMYVKFVLLFSFLVSPLVSQTSQSETITLDSAIPATPNPPTDSEIANKLKKILTELKGYEDVKVTVSSGIVKLDGEVVDSEALSKLTNIVSRTSGIVAAENNVKLSTDIEERLAPVVERLKERMQGIVQMVPLFLIALLTGGTIAWGGSWLAARLKLWDKIAPNAFIANIYETVARLGFVVLGLLVALEILDATALLGAVLGAAGVVGLAIGFAVRDTVENFIASLMLSLRQPFQPNDLVEIDGNMGRVARLTSRATILISSDGNHIRIPNSTVYKGKIINYSRNPNRRFSFVLGVDADSHLSSALSTGVDALKTLPYILDDPSVSAWINDVGDSNVLLTFTGWVDQTKTDFSKARGEAIQTAKTALESTGFGLPEPIYRLKVDTVSSLLELDKGNKSAQSSTNEQSTEELRSKKEIEMKPPSPESDPSVIDDHSEDVAAQEATLSDGGENLLSHDEKRLE